MIAELLQDMGYEVELAPATRDGGRISWHRSELLQVTCSYLSRLRDIEKIEKLLSSLYALSTELFMTIRRIARCS
jgi:hypothetical protein